jgi:hypothetical protein
VSLSNTGQVGYQLSVISYQLSVIGKKLETKNKELPGFVLSNFVAAGEKNLERKIKTYSKKRGGK